MIIKIYLIVFFILCSLSANSQLLSTESYYWNKGKTVSPVGRVYYKNQLSLNQDSSFTLKFLGYNTPKRLDELISEEIYSGSWTTKLDTIILLVNKPFESQGKEYKFLRVRKKLYLLPSDFKLIQESFKSKGNMWKSYD